MVEARDKWIREALATLTPKQRFVVECWFGLRGDREYSYREIADFMGISVRAVVRHYQRGKVRLERLAGGTQLDILGREVFSGSRTSANPPADPANGVEFESVNLSPFIALHEGYPPGSLPPGVAEYLYGDADDAT